MTAQGVDIGVGNWLLFIHQIPPKPDYFRVKVRRRLQRIGAVALKNSVYLLPSTEEALEDFQWLRRAVVAEGGEATLCSASFVEGVTDREVKAMFRTQSDAEYRDILDAARAVAAAPSGSDLQRLKRRLAQAQDRDFFDAAGADTAKRAVRDVENVFGRAGEGDLSSAAVSEGVAPFGATWVTRAGVYVDRMASAWLIMRFIDPQARFKFVSAKGYGPEPGELRFDMFEGEFTHEGDRCTFEVLVARFGLEDTALHAIAQVVHDIDLKDEKFGRGETVGVASVIEGIALAQPADAARIDAGAGLFDGLYATFASRGA